MRTHLFSSLIVGTLILLGLKGTSLGDVVISPPESIVDVSDSLMMWLRCAVVCASGVIYWGGVWVQAKRIRRKIGRTPNIRPRGTRERLLWLGWTIVVIGWIAQPLLLNGKNPGGILFGLCPDLSQPAALWAGIAIIVLGYLGTLWCYAAMGAAWRIGIDTEKTASLVETGPYRRMRHPIYSFQMVMLIGALLLLPTLASLAILL
ncbi:MAG: methyltransferase, partial [Verrucomicrobiales bacterium]